VRTPGASTAQVVLHPELFVPFENDQAVQVAPGLTVRVPELPAWVRGQRPLPGMNSRVFYRETPADDFDAHTPGIAARFRDLADYEQWRTDKARASAEAALRGFLQQWDSGKPEPGDGPR
jgi:hypothetical protein